MTYSEKILEAIMHISERDSVNMFEAATQYCQDHDMDPSEFAEGLDAAAIEQLKFAAISGRHVRKCVQRAPNSLL